MDLSLPKLNPPIWAAQGNLPETLNVVCVKWGTKYAPSYVDRLYASVEKNLPADLNYQFYCITEDDVPGVITIPPEYDWGTWWQKMNMFNPDIMPPGPTLYLDLDVVITGSLEPLIRSIAAQPLIMVENFSPNKGHCAHNSSAMLFDPGDIRVERLYREFEANAVRAMDKLHGDQCAIWRILRDDIANFERQYVVSYKYHCRGRGLPKNARVVVFHGKPDPHEVPDPWVKQHWKG
jgi:hypothetical protein